MSFSNEIRFKIGGDTSGLSSAFAKAQSVAAAAGAQIERKLGLKDALRSSVVALGLSVETIAGKIAEAFSGGSLLSWNNALSAAQQAAQTIEQSTLARMSTLRQIADLEKRIVATRANEDAKPREVPMKGWKSAFDTEGGKQFLSLFGIGETEGAAAERAQTATAKRLADEARVTALKEQQRHNEEKIATARRELDAIGLAGQEKINAALEEADRAAVRFYEARARGAETTELELAHISRLAAVKRTVMEVEAEQARQRKVAEAEQAHARDRALAQYKEYLDAQAEFAAAKAAGAPGPTGRNLAAEARAHHAALSRGELGAGADSVFDPRHVFEAGESASPPSSWDLRYGGALKARTAAMDAGIAARNGRITSGVNALKADLAMGLTSSQGNFLRQREASASKDEATKELRAAAEKLQTAADGLIEAFTPIDVGKGY